MTYPPKTYPAKVLLFGEYAVLRAGTSLAVPFHSYSGHWVERQKSNPHQKRLLQWADYIEEQQTKGQLRQRYRLAAFRQMLCSRASLHFHSTIPPGYGLGSSGALCAAFYDTFSSDAPQTAENLQQVQRELAVLESFFHGKSSGTDPLVSLFQRSVLRQKNERIRLLPSPPPALLRRFYLIDSGQTRKTGPLVELFLKKCQSPSYLRALEQQFLPATRQAIDALLNGCEADLAKAIKDISRFQWHHLREMIPPSLRASWEAGLAGSDYRIKLCGAGGGGFFLGYKLSGEKTPETALPLL